MGCMGSGPMAPEQAPLPAPLHNLHLSSSISQQSPQPNPRVEKCCVCYLQGKSCSRRNPFCPGNARECFPCRGLIPALHVLAYIKHGYSAANHKVNQLSLSVQGRL